AIPLAASLRFAPARDWRGRAGCHRAYILIYHSSLDASETGVAAVSVPRVQQPVRAGGGVRPGRADTAAKLLYRGLKAEIVSMRRKPGESIVEREIAARFGVSRTPVREAILRLADEALVDIFPQSGTFVAKIPLAALPEAILVRSALEQLTARLAA